MVKICLKCTYDTHIPGISFDAESICNYCHIQKKMERDYSTSGRQLDEIVDAIKKSGQGKRYDCVIGVSGGCDSSYHMWKLKEKGLRMLAVHWDNNWNTKTAEENMRKMTEKLNMDFIKIGIDRDEYDDLCKSFLTWEFPVACHRVTAVVFVIWLLIPCGLPQGSSSNEDFEEIMKQPIKTYLDYETYPSYFKKNKAMFKDMLDKCLIPETFFVKYTS